MIELLTAESRLPAHLVNVYRLGICREVRGAELRLRPEQAARLVTSWRKVMEQFKPLLASNQLTDKDKEGLMGWLAWCTREAAAREEPTPDDLRRFNEDTIQFYNELSRLVEGRMLPGPLPQLPHEAKDAIRRQLRLSEKFFAEKVKELEGDWLFPAFKAPLTAEQKGQIRKRIEESKEYGRSGPLRGLMDRDEEAYTRKAVNEAGHLPKRVLFSIVVELMMQPYLEKRWGYFDAVQAGSIDGHWPIMIQMRPVTVTTQGE